MLYLALYLRFAGENYSDDTVGGTPAGGIVGTVFIYLHTFGWSFSHSLHARLLQLRSFPREFGWSACHYASSLTGLWTMVLLKQRLACLQRWDGRLSSFRRFSRMLGWSLCAFAFQR